MPGHTITRCPVLLSAAKEPYAVSVVLGLSMLTFLKGMFVAMDGFYFVDEWQSDEVRSLKKFSKLSMYGSTTAVELQEQFPGRPIVKVTFDVAFKGYCTCYPCEEQDYIYEINRLTQEERWIVLPEGLAGDISQISLDQFEPIEYFDCYCGTSRIWQVRSIELI
jgi:hypothetical protein